MNESLTVTGAIVAVAVAAAIVSAPALLRNADTHPVTSLPVPSNVSPPVVPSTGPLAVIASPVVPSPQVVATAAPAQSRQVVPDTGSASRTAPGIGPAAIPSPNVSAPVPAPDTCLIGLVLDPLLGVCVG